MILVVSDLHLTDRPRDEYRFKVFEKIKDYLKENPHINNLVVCGDLTDEKDKHTAKLVDQICNCFLYLTENFPDLNIHVLKGNHDFISKHYPFFSFFDNFERISYYASPFLVDISGFSAFFLPFSRNPGEDWKSGVKTEIDNADIVFMHQTFTGAKTAGRKLEGTSIDWVKDSKALLISGDVHVPQRLRGVNYVGTPYHINFGDEQVGRMIEITEDRKIKSIELDFPRKWKIEVSSFEEFKNTKGICTGDQLKVVLNLDQSEYVDWHMYKKQIEEYCKEKDLYLHSVELNKIKEKKEVELSNSKQKTKKDILKEYCEKEGIPEEFLVVGREYLDS